LIAVHLHVDRSHTEFACSARERVALREEFDGCHSLLLPNFLDAHLLDEVRRDLLAGDVVSLTYEVGDELGVKADLASALLEFLANDPVLFEAIDTLTGCGPIGCFTGRLYEMRSGGTHQFDWHDDLVHDRLIAMSVNLGTEPYKGGVLQIADASSRALLHSVANVGFGDAVIFRLARTLIHRITPVDGSTPKVAYAGWFCSRPSYQEVIASLLRARADAAQRH
jgi:hypothetical protein